jgi:uncharacterized protein
MDSAQFFDALADVPNLRSAQFTDVEMVETQKGYKFDGIAAPTGVAADLGDWTEEYERGSFRRFLAACSDNIPFLHEHNSRDLMATTRSGRLKLTEEVRGLRAQADVVKTDLSERIKALVDSGDIYGMSVGMVVGRENHKIEYRSAKPHRTIRGFRKLLDVCTTFDPAYASTEAQFRSMTMQYAGEADTLQQLLMGAYPQLQAQGNETAGTGELAPADETEAPDGELEAVGEGDGSGAVEQRSLAARRRALSFLLLNTGDISHET